jgi:hypothetical protein
MRLGTTTSTCRTAQRKTASPTSLLAMASHSHSRTIACRFANALFPCNLTHCH